MSTMATTGKTQHVVLAHGGGGELMHDMIQKHVLPALRGEAHEPPRRGSENGLLQRSIANGVLTDSAVLPWPDDHLVFTTDSFVVTPLEFPGGDIGRLAVAGTVNDLAVMGAEPIAISLALILEEGLPLTTLDRIMASVGATSREAGVEVVTGDTKVIERRTAEPGMFINTAGVGRIRAHTRLGVERIEVGDCILVNGRIAEHGLAVMSVRNGLEFSTPLMTDAAPLAGLISEFLKSGVNVRFLRDATRGGIAGVLADICEGCGLSVEIEEERIPLSPTARHAAEMLGLDPLTVANEGKCVCVVSATDRERALEVLRAHPLGRHAACVGTVTVSEPPLVELITRFGGRRIVQRPYGEELPRIC